MAASHRKTNHVHSGTRLIGLTLVIAALGLPQLVSAQDIQADGAAARAAQEKAAARAAAKAPVPNANEKKSDTNSAKPADTPETVARRAGEDSRGRALILGMSVQEGDRGVVKVVEVAAASAAFEAGIRPGDELLAFGGFQGESYKQWIDGVRKMVTAADENTMMTVAIRREGSPIETKIRIPESHTGTTVKLPLVPPPQQGAPLAEVNTTTVIAPANGVGVGIENAGPFADFFGGANSPAHERAIAELARVGQAQPPAGAPAPAGQPVANGTVPPPTNQPARIGLAGFRDDPNGMMVMVDAGAFPPGNYLVAITDPSVLAAPPTPGVQPPPAIQPARPPVGTPAPPQTPPLPPPGKVGAPQSSASPAANQEIPRGVLAQVANGGQSTNGDTTVPPTGQVNNLTAPATGQVNPSDATPTGQSKVNIGLEQQAAQANAARAANGNVAPQPQNQIGILTVDQSGTGRLQKAVEGMHVRDVVGQAIVLYSQGQNAAPILPSNLDSSIDPASAAGQQQSQPRGTQQPATAAAVPKPPGTVAPVAGGVIRYVSDRRPGPGDAVGPGNAPNPNGPVQQPANNTPPGGNNPLR